MNQKSDKSKNNDNLFAQKPDKNGGTGDMFSNLNNKFNPVSYNTLKDSGDNTHFRHPSKNKSGSNKDALVSIYAQDNIGDGGDVEAIFSQELKSLDIARGEDDLRFNDSKFQPSPHAIVMNHSVLDSYDIANHIYSEKNNSPK